MPSPRRIAWDSNCLIAWMLKEGTTPQEQLTALAETMRRMIRGHVRIVASSLIELEVRADTVAETHRFHQQLRASPYFETFTDTARVRTLASHLADRVQESGRRGRAADLIHVATAIVAGASELWTTETKMLSWHVNKVIPEIRICQPYLEQGVLDFPE